MCPPLWPPYWGCGGGGRGVGRQDSVQPPVSSCGSASGGRPGPGAVGRPVVAPRGGGGADRPSCWGCRSGPLRACARSAGFRCHRRALLIGLRFSFEGSFLLLSVSDVANRSAFGFYLISFWLGSWHCCCVAVGGRGPAVWGTSRFQHWGGPEAVLRSVTGTRL